MRGLVLEQVRRIALRDDLPEPVIEVPTDVVVEVTVAGLCGSDLHPYRGHEPARTGVVTGHELVGEIVAAGSAVTSVGVGDRVLAAFSTSCGHCRPCRRGLTARCTQGQLFGWGPPGPDAAAPLAGAQAERIRVPLADGTLLRVPDDIDDVTALLLADNLPTAVEAVDRTGITPDQPLVVVGLGAVGLLTVLAAVDAGAAPILAVDPVGDRQRRAELIGVTRACGPEEAPAVLAGLLDDGEDGAAAVVEAAGTIPAQRLAVELTRPGGTLSTIAAQTADAFALTPVEAYDRNLSLRFGRASARVTTEPLLHRVATGDLSVPTEVVVTHLDVPLEQGPALYERFDAREDGLLKAVFRP